MFKALFFLNDLSRIFLRPTDSVYAKKPREIIGRQNVGDCDDAVPFPRVELPGEHWYRDILLDIGTDVIAHVEMLTKAIAQL